MRWTCSALLVISWLLATLLSNDALVGIAGVLALVAAAITRGALGFLERKPPPWVLDHPRGRKDHDRPTPLVGGIAIFAAVTVPCVLGLLSALLFAERGVIPWKSLSLHLPGVASKAPELLTILLGAGAMLLLGHADDRRGLSPWLRLGVQGACGLLLWRSGLDVTAHVAPAWAHGLMTVTFMVFLTNAMNFIDNMNGLLGGTALITALHLLVLAISSGQLFMAAILLCLAAGLLVFLPRNFPRARVFMGDAGSLSLGFLLASLTIAFTFEGEAPSVRPVLVPVLILLVPIADGATVIIARLGRGVHPFTAGHDHLSHRLVARGLSRTQAVARLWSVGILSGIPAYVLMQAKAPVAFFVWMAALLALGALGFRFRG